MEIALQIDRGMIAMKLSDNGGGFDEGRANAGEGLFSMRKRAEKLGGKLTVISSHGIGTTLTLRTQLK